MFSTLKSRLLLGVYIFIILSIPVGAYLASQTQTIKSQASETTSPKPVPKPTLSPKKELLSLSESDAQNKITPSPSPESDSSSPTIATNFGPTLSLKIKLEGRPENNQSTKLFVGIFEGTLTSSPKFILSFSLDLPADGSFANLSLAGLTSGTQYTAILKGPAQLAASSTFTMSPTVTNLNDGQPINLLTGDLNEDNVVNSQDLTIAQKALNTTKSSSNWNEIVDFNLDGIVNLFDLALINKNMNQTGASGVWTSPIPKVGSPSASLRESHASQGGYWIWLPR